MFTPPPSPQPPIRADSAYPFPQVTPAELVKIPATAPVAEGKRRIGPRNRWMVLLVPLVVVLVTASTRYVTHPAAFDMFSSGSLPSLTWNTISQASDWKPHKRHPEPEPQAAPTTSGTAQPLPTIPSSTSVPTPFPQPFDSSLSQNFSSTSCLNFFTNMTNTPAFRTCRSFAMLLQSSNQFIEAQHNLTLLNSIVWGTCNAAPGKAQCISNMGWFASTLRTACDADLEDGNSMAVDSLKALQAYDIMYDAGCLQDPTTNTYCFINAVRNSNPADLYFYQLPLGLNFPKTATPTCSGCTRSLMGMYAAGLSDTKQAAMLSGLKKTYGGAAQVANEVCGTGFAQTLTISDAGAFHGKGAGLLASVTVIFAWSALGLSS